MKKVNSVFYKVIIFASKKLKCKVCGELHTGVYSSRVCIDCYNKGHR